MEFQDRAEPQRSLSRPVLPIVLGALVAVAVFVLLVLTSIVLYRVTSTPQTEQLSLTERFPGYFRTRQEQRQLERMLLLSRLRRPLTSDWVDGGEITHRCTTEGCSLGFGNASHFIPLTPAGSEISYACCNSSWVFITPDYMVDTNGINRSIASFHRQRQYFYTENCRQAIDCAYCDCSSIDYFVTAVYVVEGSDQYDVGFFKLKGCCKCLNLMPP